MPNGRSWFVALCFLGCPCIAEAQLLNTLFPEGVPGYGAEQGVTVQSRARPQFDPLGVRLDTLMIRPLLAESIGYDDNIFGGLARRGAWEIATRPSVLVGTENSDGNLGLYF